MLAGINPDIARQDLYECLARGEKVKYDLYVQILELDDIDKLNFDVYDATKIWPEDKIPLIKVGTMTLDKNPDNFFVETNQAAFAPSNLVPGIEASNDKLLQGRLFACTTLSGILSLSKLASFSIKLVSFNKTGPSSPTVKELVSLEIGMPLSVVNVQSFSSLLFFIITP